ncbi:phosphoribosylanthranilate isomerase [soil metagenome]
MHRPLQHTNYTTKLKVCGMGTPDNILEIASLKPDYLGFIFYESSPRNFNNEIPVLSPEIKKTGVFVNARLDFIKNKTKEYSFDAIQLHGEESPEFCKELRTSFLKENVEIELIKVFSIIEEFDFTRLANYEGYVNYFLFDTKGKNKGGNGYSFNWEILKNYPSSTPFFLSGGIGVDDIEKLKSLKDHFKTEGKQHLLYAIDVNSKFEDSPGVKNKIMLEKFMAGFY